jgi:hypothetical protein
MSAINATVTKKRIYSAIIEGNEEKMSSVWKRASTDSKDVIDVDAPIPEQVFVFAVFNGDGNKYKDLISQALCMDNFDDLQSAIAGEKKDYRSDYIIERLEKQFDYEHEEMDFRRAEMNQTTRRFLQKCVGKKDNVSLREVVSALAKASFENARVILKNHHVNRASAEYKELEKKDKVFINPWIAVLSQLTPEDASVNWKIHFEGFIIEWTAATPFTTDIISIRSLAERNKLWQCNLKTAELTVIC